ncbi:hypothetical protein OUZ56_029499 [Daphnia magna]|uniref:Uncharacterized protein n=1 Tax=Daphnia magna TaxID=35525 RepID=A0ABR0B707_9CRUS|nr:hypothetical protein OUZ56_029499 [Daphnia magna]
MPKRASQKARKKQREEEKAQTMHLGGDLEKKDGRNTLRAIDPSLLNMCLTSRFGGPAHHMPIIGTLPKLAPDGFEREKGKRDDGSCDLTVGDR